MIWQVLQTRRFARVYKKLTQTSLIADTDAADAGCYIASVGLP